VQAGEPPDLVRGALFALSHLLQRDFDGGSWLPSIVNLSAYIGSVTFFEPDATVLAA